MLEVSNFFDRETGNIEANFCFPFFFFFASFFLLLLSFLFWGSFGTSSKGSFKGSVTENKRVWRFGEKINDDPRLCPTIKLERK